MTNAANDGVGRVTITNSFKLKVFLHLYLLFY